MRAYLFPGQGSQKRGMGADLFGLFPDMVELADSILGYSVEELCSNPGDRFRQTAYVQPALYVVNTLYLQQQKQEQEGQGKGAADFLAGHSLGEYSALLAAGCIDFETGLRLVQERGRIMNQCHDGGMMAILGCSEDRLAELLQQEPLTDIDVANFNSPQQIVVSGPNASLARLEKTVSSGERAIPLPVSAAFHSRYMVDAAEKFKAFAGQFKFSAPEIPVIGNVYAQEITKTDLPEVLVKQIHSPVRWRESMELLADKGVTKIEELGPGSVLTDLWQGTPERRASKVVSIPRKTAVPRTTSTGPAGARDHARLSPVQPEQLGSAGFRHDYNTSYAYAAGSMFRGIASVELVCRMAKSGMMSFMGTGGLSLQEIESAITSIQAQVPASSSWGMNLLHSPGNSALEQATVQLYLSRGIRYVEAAAYLKLTESLVQYRFKGAGYDQQGKPYAINRIVAKVSRPETARAFMSPPGAALLEKLVAEERLSDEEADAASKLPVSDDICVESDSGGHTDGGIVQALFPTIHKLHGELMSQYRYAHPVRLGAAGGLGSPEGIAAMFLMGADFVILGSVNQCSPEAGTSEIAKDMLARAQVQDSGYAPAGDMFELGAKAQVLKRGTLFPARANKLLQIYNQYKRLEEIDAGARDSIEQYFLRKSFADVWRETEAYYETVGRHDELLKAASNPRYKMCLLFKWYFAKTIEYAINGNMDEKSNYQIHCGPAMGVFNNYATDRGLQDWRSRHVDDIARALMTDTAELLSERIAVFLGPSPAQTLSVNPDRAAKPASEVSRA